MSDTLPNVKLPKGGAWVNIYAALGISVGTSLTVQALTESSIQFSIKATKPLDEDGYKLLLKGEQLAVPVDSSGLWMSSLSGGAINADVAGSPAPVSLQDGYGNQINSVGGAINVHQADVHNVVINQYIHQDTAVVTTIAVQTSIGDVSFTVADSTGFVAGSFIHINTTTIETTHPEIISVVGNVITVDRPLDRVHFVGDIIDKVFIDMAFAGQVGTLAAPQIYVGEPPPGEVWHITRLLFSMIHGTAGDLGLFGNLAALTNGVVIRSKVSGQFGTLTNWKINGDIKTDMYDVDFDPRSGGQGNFGTSGRGSFSRTGAVLRLDGNQGDQFQVLVQDDITDLGFFAMKIQGHLEDV